MSFRRTKRGMRLKRTWLQRNNEQVWLRGQTAGGVMFTIAITDMSYADAARWIEMLSHHAASLIERQRYDQQRAAHTIEQSNLRVQYAVSKPN